MSASEPFAVHQPAASFRILAVAIAVVAILYSIRLVFCILSPPVLNGAGGLRDSGILLLLALPFLLLAGYYAEIRKDVTATLAVLVPVFFIMGGASMFEVQYTIFHVGHKFRLVDADLAAWDAALGFDWPAYFTGIVSRPWLNWILDFAYRSIWWQPLILIAIFIIMRNTQDYAALQVALPLSFLITCIIAMILPALGAYQFHGMTPDRHSGIALEFTDGMTSPILWLRQAELPSTMPTFRDLRVITFPSFHAASAMIFILAAWPLRHLRWVGLVLNGLMLAATPVQGSHYLSDIIVGAGIGAAAFAAAAWGVTAWPARAARLAAA